MLIEEVARVDINYTYIYIYIIYIYIYSVTVWFSDFDSSFGRYCC